MTNHEPYDETSLKHQEPFDPISSWQEYNDVTGAESTKDELFLLELEQDDNLPGTLHPHGDTGNSQL